MTNSTRANIIGFLDKEVPLWRTKVRKLAGEKSKNKITANHIYMATKLKDKNDPGKGYMLSGKEILTAMEQVFNEAKKKDEQINKKLWQDKA